jgi:hypothetical protein
MNRRSAIIVSGGLVLALMAGTASRVATLHAAAAASPTRIVVQTVAPTAPATATAPADVERE